jgi:SAM-dependent methyltransferase
MEENARIEWDRRHAEGSHSSLTPDPFFVSAYEQFVAPNFKYVGRALDIAGGIGRHAIHLAERGWLVTLMDISDVALKQARRHAEERDVHILAEQIDLTEAQLPASAFDLVLVFFYLERSLLPQIADALRPGGILIYKTYTREQLKMVGGPTHPMHLLEPNELQGAFSRLRILHYVEMIEDKAVAELVARKE